jgi:hypothetical protein
MRQSLLAAILAVVLGVGFITNATAARAAEAVAAESPPPKMRVTALFVPAPLGLLRSGSPGNVATVGSQPAFGFATAFDFLAGPHLFVGFAAAYTFHIVARGTTADAATAFDLTVRFGGSLPVAPKVTVYGYVAPGYSLMQGAPQGTEPQGPIVGLHAGALLDLTPAWFAALELGYQAGFQRSSFNQMEDPANASFFQTGVGVGLRI